MRERALKRREEAPEIGEVTLLNQQQTKSLFPPLAEEYRSVHVSGAARVDGRNLRNSLLRAAEKLGATMIDGEAVLLQENNRIRGVSLNKEKIMADTVIATSGAWMNELLHPLDIQFDVSAQKAQIMHLQLSDQQTEDWPVVIPPNNQYMLTFDDQRIDRKSTRLNSSHVAISYAVFCLKKKNNVDIFSFYDSYRDVYGEQWIKLLKEGVDEDHLPHFRHTGEFDYCGCVGMIKTGNV